MNELYNRGRKDTMLDQKDLKRREGTKRKIASTREKEGNNGQFKRGREMARGSKERQNSKYDLHISE